MATAAIVYGWSEGKWQGRKFCKALQHAGFETTSHVEQADVIVAHSLGCYLIPNNKARLILLIGLPYWPGKPVVFSILQNISRNLKAARYEGSTWWLNKLLHNGWYVLSRPQDSYHALLGRKLENLPQGNSHCNVLLIRNRDDTFSPANINEMLPRNDYCFISMATTHHEDCWFEPAPYIKLIKKHYG